ncbi:hypothetical protein [Pseudooceanicola sp.]|uniref:hypothetical protein n=1 Tax=Pseudooceanicola sp. TaxID=1914328 RepID=UPI0035C74A2D
MTEFVLDSDLTQDVSVGFEDRPGGGRGEAFLAGHNLAEVPGRAASEAEKCD